MRKPERIPKIMKFFKNNKKAFNEINNIKKGNYHKMFLDRYEELFYKWINYPDLRFTQLLINEGIVPDNGNWSKEESYWLIDKEYFKKKELYLWGSFGKNGEELMKQWEDKKPIFQSPITLVESYLYPKLNIMSSEDIYGWRYYNWMTDKPTHTYIFLEDLETEHIRNILLIDKVAYRDVLEEILKEREGDGL